MQTQVDRLGDIRKQMRELRREAQAIRQRILDGTVGERGTRFVASVEPRVKLTETVPPAAPKPAVPMPSGMSAFIPNWPGDLT